MTPYELAPDRHQAGREEARDKKMFHRGMLAALAVVKSFDAETIYREIVGTTNAHKLIEACETWEDAEWNGLAQYGYIGKRSRLYRESLAAARSLDPET